MAVVTASTGAVAEESSPSKNFWKKSWKETTIASYCPLIVCLAAGNLDEDVFRQFISQDIFFHKAFLLAYKMANECVDDEDDKNEIAKLRDTVIRSQKLQCSVLEERGIDFNKEIAPIPATIKVTEFLQATALGKIDSGKVPCKVSTPFEKTKIAAYLIGAMTPCMRLFASLAKKLHDLLFQSEDISHPYKKWIENFSSFEVTSHEHEELLDKLSVSLTSDELEVIGKLYSRAMQLGIDFLYAQPVIQETVVPLVRLHNSLKRRFLLCCDFDRTCTVVDSSAILAELAVLTARKSAQARQSDTDQENEQQDEPKPYVDLRTSWNKLSTLYTEEYDHCIETILSTEKVEGFNYNGLCDAMEPFSYFQTNADLRVIEMEVLKGLHWDDIKQAGNHMILQDGCSDFFQKIANTREINADICVLSDCWCGDLIRAAFSAGGLGFVKVHSNELEFVETCSTGKIIRKMGSPLDKVLSFISNQESVVDKPFSLYIGNSVSDLLCLLQADVGIVVGTSLSLRKVGAHFGVSFIPLFPELVKKQRHLHDQDISVWKDLSGVLYTVSSWAEIHAFVLGA